MLLKQPVCQHLPSAAAKIAEKLAVGNGALRCLRMLMQWLKPYNYTMLGVDRWLAEK